jgi:hypothetical protein
MEKANIRRMKLLRCELLRVVLILSLEHRRCSALPLKGLAPPLASSPSFFQRLPSEIRKRILLEDFPLVLSFGSLGKSQEDLCRFVKFVFYHCDDLFRAIQRAAREKRPKETLAFIITQKGTSFQLGSDSNMDFW